MTADLERLATFRERFAGQVLELREQALEMEFDDASALLLRAANRLQNHHFEVVVIGEFSRGKSAFVNALLGVDLLPSGLRPTTPVVTVVREGEPGEFVCFKRGGRRRRIEPEEARRLLDGSDEAAKDVERIEIGSDHPLLRHGVRIVDTPGVNDLNAMREDVTLKYLPRADAAIFLIDAKAPFSATEQRFLEGQVFRQHISQVFFVINKADQLSPPYNPEDLAGVINRVEELVGDQIADSRIFATAAKVGLKAALAGDEEGRDVSGISRLESALSGFLATSRSFTIIDRVAQDCSDALASIQTAVDLEYDSLSLSISEANARSDEVGSRLSEVGRKLETLEAGWAESMARVRSETVSNVCNLAASGCSEILSELEGIAPEHFVLRADSIRANTEAHLRGVFADAAYRANALLEARLGQEAEGLSQDAEAVGQEALGRLRFPSPGAPTRVGLTEPMDAAGAPRRGTTLGVAALGMIGASLVFAPIAAVITGVVAAWGHLAWTDDGVAKKTRILREARSQAKQNLSNLEAALCRALDELSAQVWSSATQRLRAEAGSLAATNKRMRDDGQRTEQESAERQRALLSMRAAAEALASTLRGARQGAGSCS